MFSLNPFKKWSPASARERLSRGKLPRHIRVAGRLDLAGCAWLKELPARVTCDELIIARTSVTKLVGGLNIARGIDATDCRLLKFVGAIRTGELRLRGCTALEHLAAGLAVHRLDVAGCTRLFELPASAAPCLRSLDVSRCAELVALPSGLMNLQTLNVGGCAKLTSLPDDIRVRSWIEVADSALTTLPYSLRSVRVLWRGMPVPDRVAFSPETITADEILKEQNLEYRRLLIERMGIERFIGDSHAETIDTDEDPGGPRRLLRVPFETDEHVVCLEVHCPSTGRKYLLRVPPQMPTCAEAAAWVAGFNSARHYRPVVET
jgi:hypothetical protein